jgi:hypothetical protein
MEKWITTKVELDSNKNEKSRFLHKKCTVSSSGKILDETELDSYGGVVCKRIYRYFDTGEVQEYVEYDPKERLIERHHYYTDDKGLICRHEFEYEGGMKMIKEFSNVDLGNADKAIIRDENGDITGYEMYKFNDDNQMVTEFELDEDNNELIRYEKAYYDNGLLRFEKKYKEGQLVDGELFKYNENGLLIEKIHRNYLDNYENVEEYEYDKNENLVCIIAFHNGHFVFENKCEYDSNNNLILEEFIQLDPNTGFVYSHEKLIHTCES